MPFQHPGVWRFPICVLYDSEKYCHYTRIATSKHGVSCGTLITDDQWDLRVENMAKHHSWPTGYMWPLCSCSFGDFHFILIYLVDKTRFGSESETDRQTDIFFKGAQQSRKYSRCTPSLKSGFSKTHLRWKGAFLDPSLFKRVFSTVLAVWVDSTVVYRGFHLHGTNDSFRGLNPTPYNPSSSQGDPRQLTGC